VARSREIIASNIASATSLSNRRAKSIHPRVRARTRLSLSRWLRILASRCLANAHAGHRPKEPREPPCSASFAPARPFVPRSSTCRTRRKLSPSPAQLRPHSRSPGIAQSSRSCPWHQRGFIYIPIYVARTKVVLRAGGLDADVITFSKEAPKPLAAVLVGQSDTLCRQPTVQLRAQERGSC